MSGDNGNGKNPGRPVEWDKDKLAEAFIEYIENPPNEIQLPILAEFAKLHRIPRQYIYELAKDHKGLTDAINYCNTCKQLRLEIGGLTGELDRVLSVFSLKQLGWTDKKEVEITEKTQPLFPEPDIKDHVESRIGGNDRLNFN